MSTASEVYQPPKVSFWNDPKIRSALVQIVKGVGNYGEIFERNVGQATPLKIARGKNALWTAGGLQYAPPIR